MVLESAPYPSLLKDSYSATGKTHTAIHYPPSLNSNLL